MQAAQIELLYQRASIAMLASLIAAASIFFVFLELTPVSILLTWCSAFVILYSIRYIELFRFLRSQQRQQHLQRWYLSFVVTSALSGLLWGISGYVLIPETATETQMLLYTSMALLYTCALAAAALTTYTVKLGAYFAFALPCLLPMGLGFLFNPHEFIRTIGLLVLIFLLFLVILALRINRTLIDSLERDAENDRLLAALQHERDKAEALAARMQALSTQDSLTGIANRRHLDQFLAQEWQRARRNDEPLSLILGDLDFFKAYNDFYGHLAGDECLKKVAAMLQHYSRRASDLAARYGGEEFAIILPNTDPEAALQMAESIRQRIESLAIPHQASQVSPYITISFGVATVIPGQHDHCQTLINNADRALYQAKAEGRNRVVAAAAVHKDLKNKRPIPATN